MCGVCVCACVWGGGYQQLFGTGTHKRHKHTKPRALRDCFSLRSFLALAKTFAYSTIIWYRHAQTSQTYQADSFTRLFPLTFFLGLGKDVCIWHGCETLYTSFACVHEYPLKLSYLTFLFASSAVSFAISFAFCSASSECEGEG